MRGNVKKNKLEKSISTSLLSFLSLKEIICTNENYMEADVSAIFMF